MDVYAQAAKAAGVKIETSTDTHSAQSGQHARRRGSSAGRGFRCLGTTLPVTGFGRNVLQPLNPPVIGHVMVRAEFIELVVTKPCGNSVWLSGTSAPHRERSGRMAPVGAIVANARARDRVAGAAS